METDLFRVGRSGREVGWSPGAEPPGLGHLTNMSGDHAQDRDQQPCADLESNLSELELQ